ncbi:hypothetical protein BCV72DRAFT_217512, partial [Rhizopus microsporus var. microsporus]
FFYEYGRGGVVDDSDKEAAVFIVDPSCCLMNLTNLYKYIKHKILAIIEIEEPEDNDICRKLPLRRRVSQFTTLK